MFYNIDTYSRMNLVKGCWKVFCEIGNDLRREYHIRMTHIVHVLHLHTHTHTHTILVCKRCRGKPSLVGAS